MFLFFYFIYVSSLAEEPQLHYRMRLCMTKVCVHTHSHRSVGPKLTAERCGARCDLEKKRPSGRRRGVCAADYRGVGIERQNEREREKSQGWNGGWPTAINQNPVTYCCVLHHYHIRVQYTICAIHTRTASCHGCISTIHWHTSLCVCVCVCQNPLT